MIKTKLRAKVIKTNTVKFIKALDKDLRIQNRQAARAWLREALTNIPTYTGTARGTFKPLGRALRVSVPKFGPKGAQGNLANAAKKKYFQYPKGGRKYKLGFNEGAQYSKYRFKTYKTKTSIQISFTFNNQLLYLLWNDIYPAPNWITLPSNPPWEALDYASIAWEDYIKNVLPGKLPKLKNFQTVTFIKVR